MQMSAVLRHVKKYRPEWTVSYQAEEGKHQVARGLVADHFAYGQGPERHYDAEVLITLYETFPDWPDRPNTRVATCLHEHFGIPWDAECGRYRVDISRECKVRANTLFNGIRKDRRGVLGVHLLGTTSKEKKDLTYWQGEKIALQIRRLGMVPWLFGPSVTGELYEWGATPEMNCAVIDSCEAFVGIDSGPGKCASATDTPSLIVWTGHHPAMFHDPAPNTTHLVPRDYHDLLPSHAFVPWFESHYQIRKYDGDPVPEVCRWLRETLC